MPVIAIKFVTGKGGFLRSKEVSIISITLQEQIKYYIFQFFPSNINTFVYPPILVNDVGGLYWAHSEPLPESKYF